MENKEERSAHAIKAETTNAQKSIVIEKKNFSKMIRKSEKAMSAALRIAALAYQSSEMRNLLMLDRQGECWMEQISEGFSAMIEMRCYEND